MKTYAVLFAACVEALAFVILSDPTAPQVVTYANRGKFPHNPATGVLLACNDTNDCGDLGPRA